MMITMQVAALIWEVNLGFQETACVLVGAQIGAMNVPLAKKYARYILIHALGTALLVSVLLFVFRSQVAGWFSSD